MRLPILTAAALTVAATSGCAALPFLASGSSTGTTAGYPASSVSPRTAGATAGSTAGDLGVGGTGGDATGTAPAGAAISGPFGSGVYDHVTFKVTAAEYSSVEPFSYKNPKYSSAPVDPSVHYLYLTIDLHNASKVNPIFIEASKLLLVDPSGRTMAGERAGSDFTAGDLKAQDSGTLIVGFKLDGTIDPKTAKLSYGAQTVPLVFPLLGGTAAATVYPVATPLNGNLTLIGQQKGSCAITWTLDGKQSSVQLDLSDDYRLYGGDGGRVTPGNRWLELSFDIKSVAGSKCTSYTLGAELDKRLFVLVIDGVKTPPLIAPSDVLRAGAGGLIKILWSIPTTTKSLTFQITGESGKSATLPVPVPTMPPVEGETATN